MRKLRFAVVLMIIILVVPMIHGSTVAVRLAYENGRFVLDNTSLYPNSYPDDPRQSEYSYALMAVSGSVLSTGYIILPGALIIEKDGISNLSAEYAEDGMRLVNLFIPYSPLLKLLVVKSMNETLLTVDLMEYNRCNLNGICDNNENRVTCISDCSTSLKDGMCINVEDGLCRNDPDCKGFDPDCIIEQVRMQARKVDADSNPVAEGSNEGMQFENTSDTEEKTSYEQHSGSQSFKTGYILLLIISAAIIAAAALIIKSRMHD